MKTNVIRPLIDGLPVTIFWALNNSICSIHYTLENILEHFDYSRMDFLSESSSAKSQSFDKNKAQKYIEC